MATDYDIVVLGGGSAGIVSGVMAGGLGMRVLLVERERLGGECLYTGCVPSKALLHAARVAQTIRSAADIGLISHHVSREDAEGVLRTVRQRIDQVREADATEQLLRDQGVEIRIANAHFADRKTLIVDGKPVSADNFIIATGSSPADFNLPGLSPDSYLTNKTVFDLDSIPARMVVIGGGPIGVEMAQAFACLGCAVTLVQRNARLLPREDEEMSSGLLEELRRSGVTIHLRTLVKSVRGKGNGRVLVLSNREGNVSVETDEILVAIGRVPNTDGLELAAAGVEHSEKGITVDSHLRTTTPHIYACGDVTGEYQFSHMAEYEAKIAVRNIAFPGSSLAHYNRAPWATFTQPELARVGMTEEQARAAGIAYEVYRQPFSQNDRAITDHEAQGLVKVLTHGVTGKILGAHILSPRAGELIHEWILAMEQGLTIRAIADMIHVYPTLSMANQHAAQRWYAQKATEPAVSNALHAYIRTVRPHQKQIAGAAIATAALGVAFGVTRAVIAHRESKKDAAG